MVRNFSVWLLFIIKKEKNTTLILNSSNSSPAVPLLNFIKSIAANQDFSFRFNHNFLVPISFYCFFAYFHKELKSDKETIDENWNGFVTVFFSRFCSWWFIAKYSLQSSTQKIHINVCMYISCCWILWSLFFQFVLHCSLSWFSEFLFRFEQKYFCC